MASRLHVKSIVVEAFRTVTKLRLEIAKMMAIPVALLVLIGVAGAVQTTMIAELVLIPATVVTQTLIAVPTHRLVLLGPGSVMGWGLRSWSRRETIFALHTLLVSTAIWLCLILTVIPYAGLILGPMLAIWLGTRVSFVFPAIATDQKITVREAWRLTGSHQLAIAMALAAYPVMLVIPVMLLGALPAILLWLAGTELEITGIVAKATFNAAASMIFVFTYAALAIAYREVTSNASGT